MSKQAGVSDVVKILNHDRVSVTWIARAVLLPDGKPGIERIARVAVVYPKDGAGRLRMAVTDWSKRSTTGEPSHYVSSANGCGYDKLTAALDGCTLGGFEVGDHCNGRGVPTPGELVRREGWEVFGSDVRTS